jgi:hypothetical protein
MKNNFNNPTHAHAKTLGALPPLPKGEGRGEGEVIIHFFERRQCEISAAFPLILTFSLREKEQQLDISTFTRINRAADRLQFSGTQRAFSPLPAGESQGEGERDVSHGAPILPEPTFNHRATP